MGPSWKQAPKSPFPILTGQIALGMATQQWEV